MQKYIILQVILCIIAFLLSFFNVYELLLISGIFSSILYTVMMINEAKREQWIISPLVLYLGASVLSVGISPIYEYKCIEKGYDNILGLGYTNFSSEMPLAQAICLLGTMIFYTGYKITDSGKINRVIKIYNQKASRIGIKMTIFRWLVIISIAWLIRFLPELGIPLSDKMGSMYQFISFIPVVGPFFILTNRVAIYRTNIIIRPAGGLAIYFALIVAFCEIYWHAIYSTMREPIMGVIFYLFIGYILQQKLYFTSIYKSIRNSAMIKSLFIGIFLFAFIFIIILPFGKTIAKGGKIPEKENVFYNFTYLGDTFPMEGLWNLPYRASLGNIGLAGCIKLRNNGSNPENTVLSQVMIGIIPRILWPGKPYVSQGAKFSILFNVGGGTDERSATTATGMTAIGELYWSYGILGVVFGMMIIGIMHGILFKIFSYNFPLHPIRAWVTVLLLYSGFSRFDSDATSVYVFIIYCIIVFYPLSKINNSRQNQTRQQKINNAFLI